MTSDFQINRCQRKKNGPGPNPIGSMIWTIIAGNEQKVEVRSIDILGLGINQIQVKDRSTTENLDDYSIGGGISRRSLSMNT